MQAFPAWMPPGGTLGQIISETRDRVDELRSRRRDLENAAAKQPRALPFAAALRRADVAVIAELKRRSPSRGEINGGLSARDQAASYAKGGAAAISVLTEPRHFGGSAEDLETARAAGGLPVLKKDFHVDALQLLEARALGASAVLLIARALEPRHLARLATDAHALELEVLVEVRSEPELDLALSTGATAVGVNARDLETLEMDFALAGRLLPAIPSDRVAIAESGVRSPDDVRRAAACGADAVLVGSILSASSEPADGVRALTGISRLQRGG